jgi:2,3-bisphosphoglycerate-dependent phosphoglycerate mutase
MHLYTIRHGQSYINLPDWDGMDSDSPLTALGEKQAEAVAVWLANQLPQGDAIYSSTLRRTRGTAAIIARAYGQDILFDHRIREIGNNRIDHTPYDEGCSPPRSDWAAIWHTERPFSRVTISEGGESSMHFRIRVASFIEEMLEQRPGQTVLVVCHGGVVDAVFDYCFGIGPWRRCEVLTYNTGITHFEYVSFPGRETWRLHEHNSIDHLRVQAGMLS